MNIDFLKLAKNNMLSLAIFISVLFWAVESGIDSYVFEEETYWSRFISPDPNEAWMRLIIAFTFIAFGKFAQNTFKKEVLAHARSEETKDLILSTGSDAFIQCDHNGMIVGWNNTAELLFGWAKKEILGKSLLETVIPIQNNEKEIEGLNCFMREGWSLFNKRVEIQALHRDGKEFQAEMTVSFLKTGGTHLYNILLYDITEKKIQEEKLRLASSVFNTTAEAIIVTNMDGIIISVNPAFTKITGYTFEEVIGKNPRILKSGRHHHAFYNEMWESINTTGHWQGEIWDRKKNGEIYPKWLSITSIKDGHGEVKEYIGLFSDITRRKKDDEDIYFRAHFDRLTRLANRELFDQRLSHALKVGFKDKKDVAVFFIDLDHFKAVNDTYGHAIGDKILKMAADRLGSCIRGNDTLARAGGDEFLIVLPDITSKTQIVIVAKRILQKFSREFNIDGQKIVLGTSIGIAISPEDSLKKTELIKTADMMMYQVKTAGGGNYMFTPKVMLPTNGANATNSC